MKILRRGFFHIQRVYQYFILSRLHICSSREIQRFSFIASSSLLSSCRGSVNWIRLRNSLFTSGISIQSCENSTRVVGKKMSWSILGTPRCVHHLPEAKPCCLRSIPIKSIAAIFAVTIFNERNIRSLTSHFSKIPKFDENSKNCTYILSRFISKIYYPLIIKKFRFHHRKQLQLRSKIITASHVKWIEVNKMLK